MSFDGHERPFPRWFPYFCGNIALGSLRSDIQKALHQGPETLGCSLSPKGDDPPFKRFSFSSFLPLKNASRSALQSTYREYSIRLERLKERMINHIGQMKTEVRKRLYNCVNPQKYRSLSSDLHRRTISSDGFAASPIDQAAS